MTRGHHVRRRWWATAAIVLSTIAAGAGWYVWQQTWFGGQSERLPGTPYVLRVQSGVPGSDVALVESSLMEADAYTADELGRAVRSSVEVRLARRTPCVPFDFSGSSPTAVAQDGSLCVDTDGPGWTDARQDPAVARSVIAHEHFHVLQAETGCLPGPEEHTHAWLVEGTATWVGWQTVVAVGRISRVQVLQTMREWGGWGADLPALESFEDHIGGDAAYALAFRAVDRLVERSEPSSLMDFCEGVARGSDWRDVFDRVFGVPVEQFYADFARQRSRSEPG